MLQHELNMFDWSLTRCKISETKSLKSQQPQCLPRLMCVCVLQGPVRRRTVTPNRLWLLCGCPLPSDRQTGTLYILHAAAPSCHVHRPQAAQLRRVVPPFPSIRSRHRQFLERRPAKIGNPQTAATCSPLQSSAARLHESERF